MFLAMRIGRDTLVTLKALAHSTYPRTALSTCLCGLLLLLPLVAEAQPATEGKTVVSQEAPPGEDAVGAPSEEGGAEEPGAADDASPAVEEQAAEEAQGAVQEEKARVEALEARLAALEQAEAERAEKAEVEALLAVEEEQHAAVPDNQPLKLYGFMDMGFQKAFLSEKSYLNNLVFPTRASTFVLGNINLFLDAQPHEDWRGLVEVRFTQLPHGVETLPNPETGEPYDREDRQVQDFTSASFRSVAVTGSIILERAWIQWTANDYFKVKTGLFLTPFGIWNVDHGTPTLISLVLPSAIADLYFPYQQLGLQALGNVYAGSWELGYQAYVSNGRGLRTQLDFTEEKAFGGRLYAGSMRGVKPRLGLSGYHGEATDIEKEFASLFPLVLEANETVNLREWAVGADLSLDPGDMRIRSEFILRRRHYEALKREDFTPDALMADAYLIAAYQLPWWGLEPYIYEEFVVFRAPFADTSLVSSVGLNVHMNPRVQLKLQALYAAFFNTWQEEEIKASDSNSTTLASRLVMSF